MANMTSTQSAAAVAALLKSAPTGEIEALCDRYADDPRIQVQKACAVARRRLAREHAERARVDAMYELMRSEGGKGVVIGVDEVGRGSLAGPLTVCAVCLPDAPIIEGINDSKQLSPTKREMLALRIAQTARAIGICHIAPEKIDDWGMARALREAVAGAVSDTGLQPDCVLMDGNPLNVFSCERDIVKGDAKVACIAAASIVAKVTRDELMVELDTECPGYHFAKSKGYASPEHIQAIKERGLSPYHRVSFCGNFLETARLF